MIYSSGSGFDHNWVLNDAGGYRKRYFSLNRTWQGDVSLDGYAGVQFYSET